jgi:hypothetical protein
MINGDNYAPEPQFYENANTDPQHTWAQLVDMWRKNRHNVLAVDPGAWEDSLITVWLKYGGTISLTGEGYAYDQKFYMRADKSREIGSLVK